MSGLRVCPHCEGTGLVEPVNAKTKLADLWRTIRKEGLVVLSGDYVRTDVAALLIHKSPGTMINWRSKGDHRIPFTWRNRNVIYELVDIAEYLVRIETSSTADLEEG